MQEDKRISKLAHKWLSGVASREEEQELFDWYRASPEKIIELPEGFANSREELQQRMLVNIQTNIQTAAVSRIKIKRWIPYAAAAIIILFTSGIWLALYTNNPEQSLGNNTSSVSITPGGDKAMLTLADGSTIVLDSVANGMLAQQGGAQIVKLSNGQIAYNLKRAGNGAIVMNTMSTPKGGKYQIVLPDGSKVWLNAASSITYPTVFNNIGRRVKISGEVYFEIAKNKEVPFFVDVDGKSLIEVLGTSFNVNSYTDEENIKTTLLEGSVRVSAQSSIILKPGQQSQLPVSSDRRPKIVNGVDISQVMAWKNGYFSLEGLDIQTAMRKIARWYDAEVVYEGEVPNDWLMGEIPMNASINKVLAIMEEIGVKLRIEGKKIIVTR